MFPKVQKVFLGLALLVAFSPTTARADDEISIDLPAGAQLKVRNDFGDVSVTVWNKSYLAVSATIGGTTARFTRLPVLIDNRGSLVTIMVALFLAMKFLPVREWLTCSRSHSNRKHRHQS